LRGLRPFVSTESVELSWFYSHKCLWNGFIQRFSDSREYNNHHSQGALTRKLWWVHRWVLNAILLNQPNVGKYQVSQLLAIFRFELCFVLYRCDFTSSRYTLLR